MQIINLENNNDDGEDVEDLINDYFKEKENDGLDDYKNFLKPIDLDNFLSNKITSDPINVPVSATRGEIYLMILTFSILNGLSFTGITNLFKMINTIFEIPILPDTRYMNEKLLNSKEGVEFHAVCPECSIYIGKYGEIAESHTCSNCQTQINLSQPGSVSFFVLIDPSKQISDLVNIYQEQYEYIIKERRSSDDCLRDIYDGLKYKEFLNSLPPEDRYNYVTAIFNTDGAPKFKSSQTSIWPIYIMLNELPFDIRIRKLVTCGLWIGKKKPEMCAFVDKFVDMMTKLQKKGIQCTIAGEERLIKPYILCSCVDSIARAPLQGIKQVCEICCKFI